MKSAYTSLLDLQDNVALDISISKTIGVIWKTNVPLKIKIFTWRLFLDRLPTREMLYGREISLVLCRGFLVCYASKGGGN